MTLLTSRDLGQVHGLYIQEEAREPSVNRKGGGNGESGTHCQEQLRCENPFLKGFVPQLCTLHNSG